MYENADPAQQPLAARGGPMKGVVDGYTGMAPLDGQNADCSFGGSRPDENDKPNNENMLQLLTAVNKASSNQPLHLDRNDISVVVDDTFCVKGGGTGQQRWQCNVCPKYYATKNNLVTHLLGHYGVKPFVCTVCNKSFNQATRLKFHMLSHKGNNGNGNSNLGRTAYTCHVCERSFAQMMHLKRHLLTHENKQPYSCKACAKGFALLGELQSHLELHKRQQQQPNTHFAARMFEGVKEEEDDGEGGEDGNQQQQPTANLRCEMCGRKFLFPSQMKDHMLSHTQVRRFECGVCKMKFLKVHHLKAHCLIHSNIRPHKCELCGRAFTLKGNLIRHLLTHTKERAFECEVCCKRFSQRQTLKTHMVIHADTKPYSCDICGKALARAHNLKSHLSLHRNEKPYRCPVCNSAFTMKGNLHRHYKEKHKDAIKTTLNLDTQKTGTAIVLSSQYFSPNARGSRMMDNGADLKLDGLFNFSSFAQGELGGMPNKKRKKSSPKKRKAEKQQQRHLQQVQQQQHSNMQQQQAPQQNGGGQAIAMPNVLGAIPGSVEFTQQDRSKGGGGPIMHGPANVTCGLANAFHNSLLSYCSDSACACKFQGQIGYNQHIIHKLHSLHSAIDTLASNSGQQNEKVNALHLAIDEMANMSQQQQPSQGAVQQHVTVQQQQQQQQPSHANTFC